MERHDRRHAGFPGDYFLAPNAPPLHLHVTNVCNVTARLFIFVFTPVCVQSPAAVFDQDLAQELPLDQTALEYVSGVARKTDPTLPLEKVRAALGALGLTGSLPLQVGLLHAEAALSPGLRAFFRVLMLELLYY